MDIEVEIKAYCNDLNSIKKYLERKKATFKKKIIEKDLYFNHPARDFGKTDEALRIRNVNGKNILTYKGAKLSSESKARIEEEVRFEDLKNLNNILGYLGFVESGNVEKEREYFDYDGVEICLDRVKNLGSFVELELKGENIKEIEKKLFSLASDLGLSKFERRSYLELLYFS